MKNSDKEQYIPLPIWFIKLTSDKKSPVYLTPFEQQLYCLIKGLSNKGECYANDQYFQKIFKVTIKHINKSIHKLEHLRLLKITNENNKRLIYCIGNISKGSVLIEFKHEINKVSLTTENNVYEYSTKDFHQIHDPNNKNYNKELYGDKNRT
ncbi:MAG: hypothetical protein K9I95_04540 [Flavobacteriaceae bacterium]|nr:hypothetical protein [Flavobacteriaceae bacterium]